MITLDYAKITDTVTRTLSVIGKRAADANGNSLYDVVTLGSNELPILHDYIRTAALAMLSAASSLFRETSESDDGISLVSCGGYSLHHRKDQLMRFAEGYAVAYSLARWLSIALPAQAELYAADAQQQLARFAKLAKAPEIPHSIVSLNSVNK